MVMIAVVTSLAMRLPNPRMVCIDLFMRPLAALPLIALISGDYSQYAKYAVVMF